jgi:hypothetical protein
MPPRSGRHKQLQQARDLKRQKRGIAVSSLMETQAQPFPEHPNDEEENSSLYYLSSDHEIEEVEASRMTASLLTWKDGAGSHLRSVYCGNSC